MSHCTQPGGGTRSGHELTVSTEQPVARSNDGFRRESGDNLDLDLQPMAQHGDRHDGTRGPVVRRPLRIDRIECRPVRTVGVIDANLHQILRARTTSPQRRPHVGQVLPSLILEAAPTSFRSSAVMGS